MVVAATGFFDGVHLGHAKVIKELCNIAAQEGKRSAIVTFWPHPRSVLRQDAKSLRLLTSLDEKKKLFHKLGVDDVFVIDFTKDFSKLSAEEFIDKYLIKKYNVSTLILGYDHRIGHGANTKGTSLENTAESLGVKAIRIGAVSNTYDTISSTHIRNFIATGVIEKANEMLGYNYALSGVIVNSTFSDRIKVQPSYPLKMIPDQGKYNVIIDIENNSMEGFCEIIKDDIYISTKNGDEKDSYGIDITINFISKL